jgi:hypothetical protein
MTAQEWARITRCAAARRRTESGRAELCYHDEGLRRSALSVARRELKLAVCAALHGGASSTTSPRRRAPQPTDHLADTARGSCASKGLADDAPARRGWPRNVRADQPGARRARYSRLPELHAAIAGYTRERRGRVQASACPGEIAGQLIPLADELERLVTRLQRQDTR